MADTRVDSREAVASRVQKWKAQGLKVVFTNGVFDVLHVGHVEVLERAAAEGDRLVVGVNSDASVKRLGKGNDRPIHAEASRARLLAALRCVDAVLVFEEDTPLLVVKALKPDVLVKGGDYNPACTDPDDPAYMVGSEEVASWGGRSVAVPLVPGQSTTATLNRIRTS
ncbi:MAG: adenylyltransferase/cytidyltransferase family protein [Flavobacteriales bacterium]